MTSFRLHKSNFHEYFLSHKISFYFNAVHNIQDNCPTWQHNSADIYNSLKPGSCIIYQGLWRHLKRATPYIWLFFENMNTNMNIYPRTFVPMQAHKNILV